jgi:hypothetical protein
MREVSHGRRCDASLRAGQEGARKDGGKRRAVRKKPIANCDVSSRFTRFRGGCMHRHFTFGVAATALLACGGPFNTGDDGTTPAGNSNPPQVTTVAPGNQQQIEFENEDDNHHGDDDFDVEVRVDRGDLADPGKCNGAKSCGHLVLLVDGVACGNPNAVSSKPKFKGKLGRCVTVSGPHQIVVQLVDDNGNVLAQTQPVTVNVTFKGHHDQASAPTPPPADDHGNDPPGDDHGGGGPGGGADDPPGHG